MPYKDPVVAKQKAKERKQTWQERERKKRIAAGLPLDGRGKHGHHARSVKSYLWNDGRLATKQGYVLIRVGRRHPLADPNGYVRESLLVWVSAGNPPPKENELLHHKDENKDDDRIENLELKTKSGHNTHHNKKKKRDSLGRFLPKNDGREWNEFPK